MAFGYHKDKELEQFRKVMEVPETFEDGFRLSSFIGAVFLAMVMIPGSLYMELIAGQDVGPAAQWVTVILFIEIAKRANRKLARAEIFILYYLAGAITGQNVHGTPLFTQFLVQSEAAISNGLINQFSDHSWIAPDPNDPSLWEERSFLRWAWMPAIALFAFRMFMSKLDHAVLSYGLFRQASDVERLPFPMAPIGAQGIMALADDQEQAHGGKSSVRWRVFSMGGALGMISALLYVAIPTLSAPLLGQTFQIFPIPFLDLTTYVEDYLPAAPLGISFDFAQLIIGMVMPFWAIAGAFAGALVMLFVNPLLTMVSVDGRPVLGYTWHEGMTMVQTQFANNVDFYFSFTIGLSLVVAIIGIASAINLKKNISTDDEEFGPKPIPEGRGDIPTPWILACYLVTSAIIIAVCMFLIGWDAPGAWGVFGILLFYAFLYTPIISYVTARLEGMAGQMIEIPFIREMSFILSGYQGVAIWFLPVPKANYGMHTVFYKKAELTGTSFRSIWKTEIFVFPIILISTILFSSFIWGLAEIPGPNYPYTMQIWEFEAKNAMLLYSSTSAGFSQFDEALAFWKIGSGVGLGALVFGALTFFGAPVMLFYGLVKGLGGHAIYMACTQMVGACIGKFYFEPRFGDNWKRYIAILSSGFFCGAGLISMFCIGVVFLKGAVSNLPF